MCMIETGVPNKASLGLMLCWNLDVVSEQILDSLSSRQVMFIATRNSRCDRPKVAFPG